jgi:hypothetical protein
MGRNPAQSPLHEVAGWPAFRTMCFRVCMQSSFHENGLAPAAPSWIAAAFQPIQLAR